MQYASYSGNHNFKKYTRGQADYYGEGYDFDSVMHYGNWAFSINNKKTIVVNSDQDRLTGQRDGFSQTDVKQLNKVYKCRGYENVRVPPLKGNGCTGSFTRTFSIFFIFKILRDTYLYILSFTMILLQSSSMVYLK